MNGIHCTCLNLLSNLPWGKNWPGTRRDVFSLRDRNQIFHHRSNFNLISWGGFDRSRSRSRRRRRRRIFNLHPHQLNLPTPRHPSCKIGLPISHIVCLWPILIAQLRPSKSRNRFRDSASTGIEGFHELVRTLRRGILSRLPMCSVRHPVVLAI